MNNDNRVARSEWAGDARALHASRHEPRRIPLDGGIRPGWRIHARCTGRPTFPILQHRQEQRRVGDAHGIARWATDEFDRFDVNRDNRISRAEFENDIANVSNPSSHVATDSRRSTLNHDGWLVRSEWRGTEDVFTRLDANRDNRLSRTEYDARGRQPDCRNDSKRRVAERLRPRNAGRARGRPRGPYPPAGMGSRRASASSRGPTRATHSRWER